MNRRIVIRHQTDQSPLLRSMDVVAGACLVLSRAVCVVVVVALCAVIFFVVVESAVVVDVVVVDVVIFTFVVDVGFVRVVVASVVDSVHAQQ